MANRFDILEKVQGSIESILPGAVAIREAIQEKSFGPLEKHFQEAVDKSGTPEGMQNMVFGLGVGPSGAINKASTNALGKLITYIKEAKPVRKGIEAAMSAERSARIGKVSAILEKVEGERGFIQAKGALKGELLPKKPTFEPIREVIGQPDIDSLFIQI